MPAIKIPGRYTAKVLTAELGVSQNEKQTPYVNLYLQTDDGAHIGAYLYLSDAAFDKSLEALQKAFGFDGDFEKLAAQITSKECSIVVEEEKGDDGKMRMRVRWVNPLHESRPAPEGLAARMTARARGTTPAAAAVSSGATKDNVPF